jgi:hypothetical protein
LETHQAYIYDGSNSDRVVLTRRLGANIDNSNYQQISIGESANKTKAVNNYAIHLTAKSPGLYNLTFEVTDSRNDATNGISCKTYQWSIKSPSQADRSYRQEFEDCFSLNDGQVRWYGQAESKFQQFWPINPYSTGDQYIPYVNGLFEDGASVIERYWLSTNGLAIIVDQSVS